MQKTLPATLLFVDFYKAFDSILRKKMKEILIAYGIPKETVDAVTMLNKNTRAMVRSPDGDTGLAPFVFIICLDYMLRKVLMGTWSWASTLVKEKAGGKKQKITDVDYADDSSSR